MPVVDVFAKEGKVRHVASTGPVEEVFEETQRVVEPVVKAHVLDLNQRLLDAISAGDADTYAELCAPNLTAFEAETKGHLIEGLEFHNTYLKAAAKSKTSAKVRDGFPALHHPTGLTSLCDRTSCRRRK